MISEQNVRRRNAMINYNKINNFITKISELVESLKQLNNDELRYLKTLIEIKIKIDELSNIEKR